MRHLLALSLLAVLLLACGGGAGGADVGGDGSNLSETGEGNDSTDPTNLAVEIQADAVQGNAPLEVRFSALVHGATKEDLEYLWDFDNGSTSTEAELSMLSVMHFMPTQQPE